MVQLGQKAAIYCRVSTADQSCERQELSQGFIGRSATVLATLGLADTKLRVLPASPMDRQDYITSSLVDIGDDVYDEGSQEPLACTRRDIRGRPGGLQIGVVKVTTFADA